MREVIENALEKLQKFSDHYDLIRNSLPEGANLADYTKSLHTDESEAGLQMMYRNMTLLKSCIASSTSAKSIEVATVSSLSVKWSDTPRGQIVVELSTWGPLAAIYVYGVPPSDLIEQINTCVDTMGLIRLSDSEIDELEEQRLYNFLF